MRPGRSLAPISSKRDTEEGTWVKLGHTSTQPSTPSNLPGGWGLQYQVCGHFPLDQTFSSGFIVGWFNHGMHLTLIWNCLSCSPLDLTPILAKILTSDPYKSWPLKPRLSVGATRQSFYSFISVVLSNSNKRWMLLRHLDMILALGAPVVCMGEFSLKIKWLDFRVGWLLPLAVTRSPLSRAHHSEVSGRVGKSVPKRRSRQPDRTKNLTESVIKS